RRVGKDQFLELDLKLIQVPLALLPKAIGGEAQNALFCLVQMLDPDARDAAEAKLPSRLDPNSAVDDGIVPADQDRRAEAEGADRARHLADMGRIELADLARRHA